MQSEIIELPRKKTELELMFEKIKTLNDIPLTILYNNRYYKASIDLQTMKMWQVVYRPTELCFYNDLIVNNQEESNDYIQVGFFFRNEDNNLKIFKSIVFDAKCEKEYLKNNLNKEQLDNIHTITSDWSSYIQEITDNIICPEYEEKVDQYINENGNATVILWYENLLSTSKLLDFYKSRNVLLQEEKNEEESDELGDMIDNFLNTIEDGDMNER